MSAWELLLRGALLPEDQERVLRARGERAAILRSAVPSPPAWLATGAVEQGFDTVSPVVAIYAHSLVHMPTGVGLDAIPSVLRLSSWMGRTGGTTDRALELRRLSILVDATIRTFLADIYEAEGERSVANLLRELPPLQTSVAFVVALKCVLGLREAEYKNISARLPSVQHFFVSHCQSAANLLTLFDRLVRALRSGARLPALGMLDVISNVFSVFADARRAPGRAVVLDEYAVALIGMMVQADESILPDLLRNEGV